VLGFTPSSYDYGLVATGESATQTFTLANSSGQATGPLTVTVAGPAEFTTTGDSCTGTSLGPGKACTVSVRFAPTSLTTVIATLTAASQDPAATAAVALAGTGVTNLYWTDHPGVDPGGRVNMANHDGTNPRAIITGLDNPMGVAISNGLLYWVDYADGTINVANLDGSNSQEIGGWGTAGEDVPIAVELWWRPVG
jgi:hypothetical protein